MCRWRRVRNVYLKCGHGINLPEEEIKCDDVHCKFSAVHPRNCVPPQCVQTCWQYHQHPQQYSPNIDAFCPDCKGAKQV